MRIAKNINLDLIICNVTLQLLKVNLKKAVLLGDPAQRRAGPGERPGHYTQAGVVRLSVRSAACPYGLFPGAAGQETRAAVHCPQPAMISR